MLQCRRITQMSIKNGNRIHAAQTSNTAVANMMIAGRILPVLADGLIDGETGSVGMARKWWGVA